MSFTDPYADTKPGDTRPADLPEFMPYQCSIKNRVCIDRLPVTTEEVRACANALTAIYNAQMRAA